MNLKEKVFLRKKILKRLKDFERFKLKEISNKTSEILYQSEIFKNSKEVLIYKAFSSEIDLFFSFLDFEKQRTKKNFYLPKVLENSNKKITCAFNKLENLNNLNPGKYKNLEICDSSKDLFDFSILDLILVPGLCFDKLGNRLGRGLGYYDRVIALNKRSKEKSNLEKTKIIGVCPKDFLFDKFFFCESHDQKVDFILTERSIYYVL